MSANPLPVLSCASIINSLPLSSKPPPPSGRGSATFKRSPQNIVQTDKILIADFINSFEEVFHHDWAHSKQMLSIQDETEEQRKEDEEMGLESIHMINPEGTFLEPRVDDEIEDWGARGAFLQAYRKLKDAGHK